MTIIGNIESGAANTKEALDALFNKYKKRLDRTLRATENKIVDLTTRISLDSKGMLKGPKWTLAQAARIQGQLEGIFDEKYGLAARQFARDISGVTDVVKQAYNAVDLPIQFSKVDTRMLKTLQEQTLAGLMAFSALTQEKVAQSIQDAIIAGKPFRQLTNEIRNHITGLKDIAGRPLTQYAEVYAQDGLMTAYRRLSVQKAKEIKINYYVWMGNVVAGSRPMCARNAGRTFSEQELQELDLYSWQGKSCSVFVCCGGFSCRHHLMPISDRYFNEMKGKSIDVPNWFTENNKTMPVVRKKIINPKTFKKDMKAIGLKPIEPKALGDIIGRGGPDVGKPLDLYIGSAQKSVSLEIKSGKTEFWFTSNKQVAQNYGPNVHMAQVRMKNPKILRDVIHDDELAGWAKAARLSGHDGLIAQRVRDGKVEHITAVIFNPKQIVIKIPKVLKPKLMSSAQRLSKCII